MAWEERESLLVEDWRFHLGEAPGAQEPAFDDAGWRTLDLPHDFSIEGQFSEDLASATGFLPGGIGWYRKSLTLPASLRGKRVSIAFDGVYCNSEVWCNDVSLGVRPSGYASFAYDLTPHLRWDGQPNVLAVRVDHTKHADSRWYTGSGIYRDVWLVVTHPLHVARHGLFVTTPEVTQERAVVAIDALLRNETDQDALAFVEASLLTPEGRRIGTSQNWCPVPAKGEAEAPHQLPVEDPHLWSPETPALYRLSYRVKLGEEWVDSVEVPFGIRSIRFDPNEGFLLNGVETKMRGVCFHHDAGALGATVPAQVWERRLRVLKEMGCNAVRMSHNPPAAYLLDLCDRLGLLVMDEAFDEWTRGKRKWVNGWNKTIATTDGYHEHFEQWSEADLREMVLRDRNHPSVVLWSIGNEIDYPNDPYPENSPELLPIAQRLAGIVRSLDTTRPVTAALAAVGTCLFPEALDVVGYNYQEGRYEEDHRLNPGRVITGSENFHTLEAWEAVERSRFISGQFLWTGIDFLGEAGPWPNRGSRSGVLDLAAFPKPGYHFRKSLWTAEPMVHLEREGGKVTCYTNCEAVELFLEGQSLGEKLLPSSRVLAWEAGVGSLRAVGRSGEVEVCSFELPAAGPAEALVVGPDAETLAADGRDVLHLEVEVVDGLGRRVPDATPELTCRVSGPILLLGMESGNQFSHEHYPSATHRAHQGRMLVILRSQRQAGPAEVVLSSPGLKESRVSVRVG
ncbi:MAG TPA: glycoside hydrolase family 2 TIM barrel-domain containing protein [Armatimonadota bacterium]|jgi:beta-galactosidase/beta-glucuronidase